MTNVGGPGVQVTSKIKIHVGGVRIAVCMMESLKRGGIGAGGRQ